MHTYCLWIPNSHAHTSHMLTRTRAHTHTHTHTLGTHTHTHTQDLRFTVSGDVENVERRIIFENGNTRLTREVSVNINLQRCETVKAYVWVCARILWS